MTEGAIRGTTSTVFGFVCSPSSTSRKYIFKHALTQEVAYNSVLLERRKRLHEHVGHAIADDLHRLAGRSRRRIGASFFAQRKPGKGRRVFAFGGHPGDGAGSFAAGDQRLRAALALLKASPSGAERDALELRNSRSSRHGLIAVRGYAAPEVGPVFVHARELCERIGRPPQLFAVVWGNFAWHVVRGEIGLSMDLAREAIGLAERFEDPGIWMEALFLLGLTLFYRGDFIGALAQYEKALSHYDDREHTALWASHVGQDAGITHRCYLALALWQLGYPEQALRVSQETLKLARAIRHPFSLAYAQHHTSWLYHQLGLPAETKAASEDGIQTAAKQGFAMFHATGTFYQAAGVLLEGHPNEALPLLKQGLEAYRATGAGLALPYYLRILGDAYIQAGRPDDARDVLDEGLAIAERSDELCQKAELYRLKGELALRTGSQNGDAEVQFRRAIGTAQHQLSKAWELRATTSLARLCQQQGRRDEARQMLTHTYGQFTEGFDTPDLKSAKALLDDLGGALPI